MLVQFTKRANGFLEYLGITAFRFVPDDIESSPYFRCVEDGQLMLRLWLELGVITESEIPGLEQEVRQGGPCHDWAEIRTRVASFKIPSNRRMSGEITFDQCACENKEFVHGTLLYAGLYLYDDQFASFQSGFQQLEDRTMSGSLRPEEAARFAVALANVEGLALTDEEVKAFQATRFRKELENHGVDPKIAAQVEAEVVRGEFTSEKLPNGSRCTARIEFNISPELVMTVRKYYLEQKEKVPK